MFYCYILKSTKNNAYYIGSCNNIEKRLEQHNKRLVRSTKRYAPWTVIYKEELESLKKAKNRELQIKRWKSRSAIQNLIKKHFKI